MRERSDGAARFDDVFDRMNAHEGPVSYEDFRRMVEAETGASVAIWLDEHVRDDAVPDLPTNASAYPPAGWTTEAAPSNLYFCVDGEWRTRPLVLPADEPVAVFDATYAVTRFTNAERVSDGASACDPTSLPVSISNYGEDTPRQYVFTNDTTVTLRSAYDPEDATQLSITGVERATATPTPTVTETASPPPTTTAAMETTTEVGATATDTPAAGSGAAEPPAFEVQPRGFGVEVRRGAVRLTLGTFVLVGGGVLLVGIFAAAGALLGC